MKLPIIAAVAVAIPFIAVDYVNAQEHSGLGEKAKKEIREMIRQEIQAAKKREAKATSKALPKIAPLQFRWTNVGGKPVTILETPTAAERAIAAAERAVEADKSLTKKQRVGALEGLEAARKAIGKGKKKGKAFQNLRFGVTPQTLELVPGKGRTDLYFDGKKGKTDTDILFVAPDKTGVAPHVLTLPPARLRTVTPGGMDVFLLQRGDSGLRYFLRKPDSAKDKKAPGKKRKKSKKRPSKII